MICLYLNIYIQLLSTIMSIRMFSLSWCYRSPPWKSIDCSMKLFEAFLKANFHSSFPPNSFATRFMLLMLMFPVRSSSNKSNILLIPFYIPIKYTLDSLSPNLAVIASKNSSKSIYRPSLSRSAIILKMVGFLDSKPKLCMADLSHLNRAIYTSDQFCQ